MLSVLGSVLGFAFKGVLFRNRTTSTITGVFLVIAAAFGWHKLDKASAVRAAVIEYVAGAELAALRIQARELAHRAKVAEEARAALEGAVLKAEEESRAFEQEVLRYEQETEVNPSGVVDRGVLDLLRSN